jgi:tetratricopeptide (TPR) repeat protein
MTDTLDESATTAVENATAAMDLSGGDNNAPSNDIPLEHVNDATAKTSSGDAAVAHTPNATPSSPGSDTVMEEEGDGETKEDSKTEAMDESSSASTEKEEDDDDEDVGVSPNEADLLLLKATGLKEEGNTCFKEGDLEKAARVYRRAVNSLKKLNKNSSGDEQVKALLVTLHTNLSTVTFKQNKYKMSVDVASQALGIDATNVKALYRRAVGYRKLGNWEAARDDLKSALRHDPNNLTCKKEFASLKQEIETTKEKQKKSLAKAFSSKAGSFLYEDKEEIEKRKQEEERRKKLEEEEQLKKRKAQWEDECVTKLANGETVDSFEEWDKKRKEQEEQERKRKAKERKEAERRRKEQQKATKKSSSKVDHGSNSDEDDDDELTEAELAKMRGYKKTADGRTTSYFTRELSEEEKRRIGDIAPKRLDEVTNQNAPVRILSNSSANSNSSGKESSRPSVWNQAGTWEEKDATAWCNAQLRKRLQETNLVTDRYDVDVVSVEEMTGDASVAIVANGKKRYIFDFHTRLKFEVKQSDNVIAEGIVRLPDICSTHHEEIEVLFDAWKKRPKKDFAQEVEALRDDFARELRNNVQAFVQDFNAQF